MLQEFLTHLFTPAPNYVKKMGYLHELIAISARYKRCRTVWQPHLDLSKDFILQAVNLCSNHKKAVVLGSGLLLDIPLTELSQTFEEVLLVDMVHLSKTKRKIRSYSNVFTLAADITGVAHAIYKTHSIVPIETTIQFPGCDSQTDLLISANILSQLPLCPTSFLMKKCHATETAVHDWAKTLIEDHLKCLASLKCTVCLITDHSMYFKDEKDKIYHIKDTLYGIKPEMELPDIKSQWEWQWKTAPLGEISTNYSMTMKVMGLIRSK